MFKEHIIDGKRYISAPRAGAHFEYTKDYLLLLIKEGKIEGKKFGHRWYVCMDSAEDFFATAKKEREARRAKISEIRKEELKAHTAIRSTNYQKIALVETLVIVVIGLSIGATGYLGTTATHSASVTQSDSSFFETIARSFYEFFGGKETTEVKTTNTSANDSVVSTQIGTTTVTSLVVAPDELFTATTIDSIQDSFSDPVTVSVDPNNPSTGIITPEFKDTEGEAYRFLLVPVTTETQ